MKNTFNKIKRISKAFSLIELLVSLIIISIIMAFTVPMLSKKLKHQEITYTNTKPIKNDCTLWDTEQGTCLLCTDKDCKLCSSSINIPDGWFVNPNVTCNKQSCNLFDSKCKRCTKDGCQECSKGYKLENGKCKTTCPGVIVSLNLSGSDKLYCFTKRNLGDDSTAQIYKAYTDIQAQSKCSKINSSCSLISGGDYSGCNRTVCTYNVALNLCNRLKLNTGIDWRLPTRAELDVLAKKINSESKDCSHPTTGAIQRCAGKNGLQLCSLGSNGSTMSRCDGAFPYVIYGQGVSELYISGSDAKSQTDGQGEHLQGVRCVYEIK